MGIVDKMHECKSNLHPVCKKALFPIVYFDNRRILDTHFTFYISELDYFYHNKKEGGHLSWVKETKRQQGLVYK